MSGIQSFKDFVGKHRHLMTPDQALKADQTVMEANVHTPSSQATTDQEVASKFLGDPDWFAKHEGNDPTARPLYPTIETQAPQATTQTESNRPLQPNVSGEGKI